MMTLCFECHDREIKLESGVTLGNIKQVIETGRSLHGPVSQSNCAACHQIHGGDFFRLLVQEYPAEFYAPFKEETLRSLLQLPRPAPRARRADDVPDELPQRRRQPALSAREQGARKVGPAAHATKRTPATKRITFASRCPSGPAAGCC